VGGGAGCCTSHSCHRDCTQDLHAASCLNCPQGRAVKQPPMLGSTPSRAQTSSVEVCAPC
jgi:hypothetical protein